MGWQPGEDNEIKRVMCLFKKGEITDGTYEVKRKFTMQEKERK